MAVVAVAAVAVAVAADYLIRSGAVIGMEGMERHPIGMPAAVNRHEAGLRLERKKR